MKMVTAQRVGVILLGLCVLLTVTQLVMFDHAIATSGAGFTDKVANETDVITPLVDFTTIVVTLALAFLGVFLSVVKPRMVLFRVLLATVITGVVYFVITVIEVQIQQHLSGFKGV